MKVRRVKTLTELPDAEFLVSAAQGAELSLQNADRLYGDAQNALAAGAQRGYLVLCALAQEEVSKSLILVDAVRCPPSEQAKRSKQLAKFSEHLARMIYSEVCGYKPNEFRELEGLIEGLREEYFLDGPSGFDWIYRNRLLQEREGTLYVDYVEAEDERRWDSPNEAIVGTMTMGGPMPPESLVMARHLRRAGIFLNTGMGIVAQVWRGFVPTADVRWASLRALNQQTLARLEAEGLCDAVDERDLAAVREDWPFPLWGIDMGLKEVKFESLRAARDALAARYPDGF